MDLGDVWTGRVEIRDSSQTLAAATVTLTVTLPDLTTVTPAVTTSSTGVYTAAWPTTQVGRHAARWVATGAITTVFTDVFDVADPACLPIVGMTELREHLRRAAPGTATQRGDDEHLRTLATIASDLVEKHCGRLFRRRTVVESYNGGDEVLMLRSLPAVSVTSVTESGTTVDPTFYVLDTTSGLLHKVVGVWDYSKPQAVQVTYLAGPTASPTPIRQAVLRLVELQWDRTQQAPHVGSGQGLDDEGAPSALQWALPYQVASWLEPYRSRAIA